MIKKQTICDKCKKEIKEGFFGVNKEALEPVVNGYHLCNKCLDLFLKWL